MKCFKYPCPEDGVLSCYVLNNRPERNPDQSGRPAVVIVPGGGYEKQMDHEGECVALQFAAQGCHAFILHYATRAEGEQPLLDRPLVQLAWAVAELRRHAEQWNLDPDKIAVIGFSAGGHLAGSLGVHWHREWLREKTGLDKAEIRPNALILAYPVITTGAFAHHKSIENLIGEVPEAELLDRYSLEKQVSSQTPPCFVWTTRQDELVPPQNSMLFVNACLSVGVPVEMMLFSRNWHGLSLANRETMWIPQTEDPHIAGWFRMCMEWLQQVWHPEPMDRAAMEEYGRTHILHGM